MQLTIGYPQAEAWLLGGYQRPCELGTRAGNLPYCQRLSGGGAVRIGPGTLWLQLRMDLGELPGEKLVNRHVRPLLKALTRVSSKPAHYFGRDWVALGHRPVAFVGFAHTASGNVGVLEAVVAVDAPLSPLPSFREKEPVALGVDHGALLEAVVAAYNVETDRRVPSSASVEDAPPWAATVNEPIGLVAAGPDATGRLRIGGELMASLDAIAKLEGALAAGEDVDRAIEEELRGATIFGVSRHSIREVIVGARAAASPPHR